MSGNHFQFNINLKRFQTCLIFIDLWTYTSGTLASAWGFQPAFQYVPGNSSKISGKHFKMSDNYDVGGSFKIFAVDVEAGINVKELGEDVQKGVRDLGRLLRDGWGPFFRPLLPTTTTSNSYASKNDKTY